MKTIRQYISEAYVVYRHDQVYDELLDKISLLPEDRKKDIIKQYNQLVANGEQIDINKLIDGDYK